MREMEYFFYNVYALIDEIPRGCVVSYGQLASLVGSPNQARMVGRALRYAGQYGKYPCHRVVGHNGKLSTGFVEQRTLLEAEGITFSKKGYVNMKQHQWNRYQ